MQYSYCACTFVPHMKWNSGYIKCVVVYVCLRRSASRRCCLPESCEKGDPGSLYSHCSGNIGTRVPIFRGVWGPGIPIFPGKWGPPQENGDPVWQTIFWEFRDPQCDAGLSTSSAMLKQ